MPKCRPNRTPANRSPNRGCSPVCSGDEKWWEIFRDAELQKLIRAALANNYDARIAASRVIEAQAQLTITHANQLPTLSAGGKSESAAAAARSNSRV